MSSSFSATRYLPPFTDRTSEVTHVIDRVQAKQGADAHRVIIFFGPGGHGKSKLSARVASCLAEPTGEASPDAEQRIVQASIDFHDKNNRVPHLALKSLRFKLAKDCKRSFLQWPEPVFPLFDIVFKLYHERFTSGISLENAHPEYNDKRPYLDHLVTALDAICLGIPGFLWNIVGKQQVNKIIDEHFGGKRLDREQLSVLSENELRNVLVDSLASDINRMQWGDDDAAELTNRKYRPVIFIDTFEALWSDSMERRGIAASRKDDWVRRLVDATPGVMYVITGRDRLQWSECQCIEQLEQIHLDGLRREDGDIALQGALVEDAEIRNKVLESARITSGAGNRVHPFYLALEARSYGAKLENHRNQGGAMPTPSDFGGTRRDVLARFIEHLSNEERVALRFLSVTRSFDRELFNSLKATFFPNSTIRYGELANRSVFQEFDSSESLSVHGLLRDHMTSEMFSDSMEELEAVHKLVFEWYDSKLDVGEEDELPSNTESLFGEAVYHAKQLRRLFDRWLITRARNLSLRGRSNVVLPYLQEQYEILAVDRDSIDLTFDLVIKHATLARILCSALRTEHLFANARDVAASTIEWLQSIQPQLEKLKDSNKQTSSADFLEASIGLIDLLSDAITNRTFGTEDTREKASETIPAAMSLDPTGGSQKGQVIKCLAYLKLELSEAYESLGGDTDQVKAMETAQEALQLSAVSMPQLNVFYFRHAFASLLDRYGRHSEAEPQLFQCAQFYDGRSNAVVLSDLGKCLVNQGRYREASKYLRLARDWFVSNDIRDGLDAAVARHTEAGVHVELGNHAEARELLAAALAHYENSLVPDHWYVALAVVAMARLEVLASDVVKAKALLRRAESLSPSLEYRQQSHAAACLEVAGHISKAEGDPRKALSKFQESLAILEGCEGLDRRPTRRLLRILRELAHEIGNVALSEYYEGHLSLAMQSCTLTLQLQGLEAEELESEKKLALAKACIVGLCLPEVLSSLRILRWKTECFNGVSLFQFEIPTVYGATTRYAFINDGPVEFVLPVNGTSEPLNFLMIANAIRVTETSVVQFAQIYSSAIRTKDDQFWILFDEDHIPSQRMHYDDDFSEATRDVLKEVTAPKLVDAGEVIAIVDELINNYNLKNGSDWNCKTLAVATTETLHTSAKTGDTTLINLYMDAVSVTQKGEQSWFIECYVVYMTVVSKCLFSFVPRRLMNMIADEELVDDPMIGFRKSVRAARQTDDR